MKKAFLFLAMAVISITAAAIVSANGSDSPERLKARYYYVEALRKQVEGDEASAYEYFKKANTIDPSYKEAASSLGMQRLMVASDSMRTPAQLATSLSLMKDFVDSYPGEQNEALYYAFVNARLDSLDEAIRVFERIDSIDPSQTVTLIHLADAYMAKGVPDKAIDALDRYEKVEGTSPQLSMKKISFMLSASDTLAAAQEVDRLVNSNLNEPTYRLIKGNFYQITGKPDSVEYYYLQAEKLAPESGEVKVALANLYRTMGDSVKYDAKIYEALLSEDFDPTQKVAILGEYAQILFNDKSDTQRGDTLFSVLLNQYPHEPDVLDLAARFSAAKGDLDKAIDQMGYATDLKPEETNFWGRLMTYQISDEKYDDAMATYRRAEKYVTAPESMTLLFASAASLGKDFSLAEQTYGKLIHDINPSLPLSDSITDRNAALKLNYEQLLRMSLYYNMLGDMYYNTGDMTKAFNAYDNSLLFYPDNAATLNNYAYFLTQNNGDLEKARSMSERAITQAPDNDTYLDTFAWVLFKLCDYKEALEYQKKAIEIAEKNGNPGSELYDHYGDILFMNQNPKEALEYWKKALDLDPENKLLKKKVKNEAYFSE